MYGIGNGIGDCENLYISFGKYAENSYNIDVFRSFVLWHMLRGYVEDVQIYASFKNSN